MAFVPLKTAYFFNLFRDRNGNNLVGSLFRVKEWVDTQYMLGCTFVGTFEILLTDEEAAKWN